MRKKLKRLLLSERGDSSYISSFIYILVAVILIAFIINVFHIISIKQEMDHMADQIVKQIQLNGGTSGETDSLFSYCLVKFKSLSKQAGMIYSCKKECILMPKKNYQVFLTDDDITVLNNIRKNGHSSAKTIMHANILLNTNDSFPEKKKSNRELSEIFGVSLPTVNKIRKTYCEEGLAAALNRKTRLTPETMSKITGEFEAHVIATALSVGRRIEGDANDELFFQPLSN